MNANLIAPEVIQRFAGSLLHFVWQGAVIAMIDRRRSSAAASSIRGSAIRIRDRIADLHAGRSTLHGGVLFADRRSRPAVDPRAEPGIRREGRSAATALQTSLVGAADPSDVVCRRPCLRDEIDCGMASLVAARQVGGRDSHSGRHEDLRKRSGATWTSRAHSIACARRVSILRLLWDGCAPWCCCRFP